MKREVNYLYFTLIFTYLSSLSWIHYISLDAPFIWFIYASLQALWITSSLILLQQMASPFRPIFSVLTLLTFCYIILSATQFFLARLLDSNLTTLFRFFCQTSWPHFFAAWQAIHLNQAMVIVLFFLCLTTPWIWHRFYLYTSYLSRHKPLTCSLLSLLLLLATCSVSLLALEYLALQARPHPTHRHFAKYLPLMTTLLTAELPSLKISSPIESYLATSIPEEAWSQVRHTIQEKPNIYIWIIETFRKDHVSPHITPTFDQFQKEHQGFSHSFANSNATHLSWFSLFHSRFPYHFAEAHRQPLQKGALPLQLLQDLGYEIEVFSSSSFQYFDISPLLFGDQQRCIHFCADVSALPIEPWEKDQALMDLFEKRFTHTPTQGKLFLFFLDGPHSEYSFPLSPSPPFQPFAPRIDYLTLNPKETTLIQNRYKNALFHVDLLFQQFLSILKKRNAYDDACIVATGDHGEEFFEEGALFHGTHLNVYQTAVPILLKLPPRDSWRLHPERACHLDIFPTILHFITRQEWQGFDGHSLFSHNPWPYILSVSQNGPLAPYEFLLRLDAEELHVRTFKEQPLYMQTEFELLSPSLPNFPINQAFQALTGIHNHRKKS
jgi:hypothetical protein